MPRVAADAGDLDCGKARERLRQREGAGGRRLAGAVKPDVQLDEQRRPRSAAIERRGEALGRREAIDRDRQLDALVGDAARRSHLSAPNGG